MTSTLSTLILYDAHSIYTAMTVLTELFSVDIEMSGAQVVFVVVCLVVFVPPFCF